MLRQTFTVEIEAPPADVWPALSDFGGSAWIPKVKSAAPASDLKSGVGAEQLIDHLILGNFRKRVTAWTEGQRVEFAYLDLPEQIKSMTENWWTSETSSGTLVTVEQRFELDLGDFSIMMGPFVQEAAKDDLVHALAGLKCHVETGEAVTSDFIQVAATDVREQYTSAVKPA